MFIDEEIQKMLKASIISPILTDWQSGIVIVPKPGPGDDYRFCVDYTDLNKITVPIKFPLPIIEDIMQSLGSCNYFCKLDLAKGYFQVGVEEDSKKYTTFTSR